VQSHIPCHARVQKIGRKTEEMLRIVGQTVDVAVNTVERCSGHAGTYGVKTATHPIAMKIGRPVQGDGARGTRVHRVGLPDGRAPHRPGAGGERAAGRAAAPPAHARAHGLRHRLIASWTSTVTITRDSLLTLEA
jgi:hypothetical protein